jgi:hypothetical protein
MVYSAQQNWSEAQQCFDKGLEIKKRLNDFYGIAYSEGEMGAMYLDKGEFEKARENLLSSFQTLCRLAAKDDAIRVRGYLENLAVTYRNKGNETAAKKLEAHFRSAI